jgi:hypothetical protein
MRRLQRPKTHRDLSDSLLALWLSVFTHVVAAKLLTLLRDML